MGEENASVSDLNGQGLRCFINMEKRKNANIKENFSKRLVKPKWVLLRNGSIPATYPLQPIAL